MAVDITVTSLPDSESFIAEIWVDGENVATLFEAGATGVDVEIYAAKDGEPYRVDYQELLNALMTARDKLSALAVG